MAVRFPISRAVIARVPSLFPNLSTLISATGIQNGEGDINHERISVPRVRVLSQQLRTSFNHYESAWRSENTGSNPTSRTMMRWMLRLICWQP